jgi:RNA 2',3'-cyclic 3'-phosphodiesterase
VREAKDVRLFFALWPDAAVRDCLQQAADSITLEPTVRRVSCANLHLTLHFVGNVYFADIACLQQRAREVDAVSFSLSIDCQGYFNKPRVAWLGCRNPPSALDNLQRQLGLKLRHCGFRPERRNYHPHVSVARGLAEIGADAAFAPVEWSLSEFALIEVKALENGVQYRVVESYPLS